MSGDIVFGENNDHGRALIHGNTKHNIPLRLESTKTIKDIESDCSLFTFVYMGVSGEEAY